MAEDVAPVDRVHAHSPWSSRRRWTARTGWTPTAAATYDGTPDGDQPDQRTDLWAAERFAIDYVQLSADGTLFTGASPTKPESYPYFGADIHAVADGPVVSVLDGLPEQVPATDPTGLPLEQYAGNHVVQDIGDGNYALLRPPEDRQRQGQAGRSADRRPGARATSATPATPTPRTCTST